MNRAEIVAFCLELGGVYEDYPFDRADRAADSWTVMRHTVGRRGFAFIYERGGRLCVNLKCEPIRASVLREAYGCVTSAYHMNKVHWNTVTIGGDNDCGRVPDGELCRWIADSYGLTKARECGKSFTHKENK